MTFKRVHILFACLALFSCNKNIEDVVDLDTFDEISSGDLFESLKPSTQFEYYEIRYSFCGDLEFESKYSFGSKCLNFEDSLSCVSQVDSLKSESHGFHMDCLPACCGYYIVAQFDKTNLIFATANELKSFLGDIDSRSDALLYAFGNDYYYDFDSKQTAALKEIETGYQIIALKLVSDCAPIQVDRFLLEISHDGNIAILEQEVYSKNDGCI